MEGCESFYLLPLPEMPKGSQKTEFRVSAVDEALQAVSELLMKVTKEHAGSGFANINLDEGGSAGRELFAALDQLIIKQRRGAGLRRPKEPEACIAPFMEWLHQNEVDTEALELKQGLNEGSGLVACKDIQVKDIFLRIPSSVMISTDTAIKGGTKQIKADPVQKMPSVMLATYLVLEKHKPESKWLPYIDIMPRTLDLPLFWSATELAALKGTSTYASAVQYQINTIMQYFHIRNAIAKDRRNQLSRFTFEEYRWAVGIVMSRQNYVPVGGKPQICLIPLWDMLNHDEGVMSTFYNHELGMTQSIAMRNFKKGDQLFIYYGERPNSMFLLYQGFTFPRNKYRILNFHYAYLQEGDKLNPAKKVFLMKQKINESSVTIQASKEVVAWGSMVGFRTAFASREELTKQNALEVSPVGIELSLKNEVLATELMIKAIDWVGEWKQAQYAQITEEFDASNFHVSQALALKAEEEETIETCKELIQAYRTQLRKRERRSRAKAKKKANQKDKEVLQSAVEELD